MNEYKTKKVRDGYELVRNGKIFGEIFPERDVEGKREGLWRASQIDPATGETYRSAVFSTVKQAKRFVGASNG